MHSPCWPAHFSLKTGSLCLVQSSRASKCWEFVSLKNPVLISKNFVRLDQGEAAFPLGKANVEATGLLRLGRVAMPGESFAVPTDDRVGLISRVQPDTVDRLTPQEPFAVGQATRRLGRSARISACKAARVRKVEAIKAKKATKGELIVVATMISRMAGTPVFSDRTEFSVFTAYWFRYGWGWQLCLIFSGAARADLVAPGTTLPDQAIFSLPAWAAR